VDGGDADGSRGEVDGGEVLAVLAEAILIAARSRSADVSAGRNGRTDLVAGDNCSACSLGVREETVVAVLLRESFLGGTGGEEGDSAGASLE